MNTVVSQQDKLQPRSLPVFAQGVFGFIGISLLLFSPLWSVFQLGVAALLFIAFAVYQRGYRQLWPEYKSLLALFIVLVVVDVVTSELMKRSVVTSVHLFRGLALYIPAVLMIRMLSVQQSIWVLRVLLYGSALLYLMLIIRVLNQTDTFSFYDRLVQFGDLYLGNLHNLTNCVAIALISSSVLFFRETKPTLKLCAVLSTVTCIALLLLVQSEGAFIALFITCCIVLLLRVRGLLKLICWGAILGVIGALHLLYLQPELLSELLGISMVSFDQRIAIYQQLLQFWQQSPWFGWGMGSYKYLDVSLIGETRFLYPHHLYLEALYSLGIIGCGLFVWLIIAMSKPVSLRDVQLNPVALIALLSICFLAGKGMTDMKLLSAQTFSVIALCFGFMHLKPVASELNQDAH